MNDLETRVQQSSNDNLKLWLRLGACTSIIQNELRERLRTHFKTTLPRYDLLAQISQEPDGLKMGDLSDRLMVSNGNITAITLQLEKAGLISRTPSKSDRRSIAIKMTAKGRKQFAKMENAYNSWVDELLSGLNEVNSKRIYKALGDLKSAILAQEDEE